jgi:hypothetical protein
MGAGLATGPAAVLTGDFTSILPAALAGPGAGAFLAAMALANATFADARAAFAAATASFLGTALIALASCAPLLLIDAVSAGSIFVFGTAARLTGAIIGSIRCAVAGAATVGAAAGGVDCAAAMAAPRQQKTAMPSTGAPAPGRQRLDQECLVVIMPTHINDQAPLRHQWRQFLDFLSNEASISPHLPDCNFECLSLATTGAAMAAAMMIAARMPSAFLFKRSLLQSFHLAAMLGVPKTGHRQGRKHFLNLIKFRAGNQLNKKGWSSGAPALTPVTCLTPHIGHTSHRKPRQYVR